MNAQAVAGLVGALIGGTITLLSQVLLDWFREHRKAEQLAHAIAGEASAILQIIDARGYVEFAKSLRAQTAAGQPRVISVRITHEYFPVIEANLQNIGMLPAELPLLIPKFLTFSKAALEDVNEATEGGWSNRTQTELVTS